VKSTAFLSCCCAAAAFASAAPASFAQDYPTKPIRLILGAPPGGSADAGARIVSPRLAALLGQQIVIDNRPGANNNIATELVARAQPDGYTLLWGYSAALVVNPSLYDKLAFDAQRDFVPVQLIASFQFILVVNRAVPANSVQELVALIKSSKPGQFQYASAGIGSPNHLAAELFRGKAGVDIVHVPYKGGGPATLSLLSGETKMYFASLASVVPQIKAGNLKALAVTGPKRSSETPTVPTMQEAGFPGFDVTAWHGVVAPAGTPGAIVDRLRREILKVLSMQDVQDAFKREGLELASDTPAEFAARIKSETVLWSKVIRDAGIKAE
jgi:tripartite-type tricarboxylate transporter receptor subunit TctC